MIVLDAFADQLLDVLRLDACWYEPFPFDVQLPRVEPGRIVLPRTEPGIEPWTLDRGVELPVRVRGLPIGRFVLVTSGTTSGVALAASARAEAIRIATRAAADALAALVGAR